MGGYSHGGFKYLTEAQYEALKDDPLIGPVGPAVRGYADSGPFQQGPRGGELRRRQRRPLDVLRPGGGPPAPGGYRRGATDTHVLELLGVEPELGARFTLTFDVDGHETTQTFTLSGWWGVRRGHRSQPRAPPGEPGGRPAGRGGVNPNAPEDGMTGAWNLDVMLKKRLGPHRAGHGADSGKPRVPERDAAGEDYIRSGVNWGYTGAQLASGLDVQVVAAIAAVLLLILFTGYLIIYNVFQISVTNDIRFYGLLKTIGTTGRQLRRIIRYQALASPWRGSRGAAAGLAGGAGLTRR